MIKVFISLILFGAVLFGDKDDDLDGVPNSIDKCPNTPFLHKVDSNGCTTKVLTLPKQSDKDMKLFTISYGRITDGDFKGRKIQNEAIISFSNISYPWVFSVTTGLINSGLIDTTFKIKRVFKPKKDLKINLLAGLKLPTYNFRGNRVDPLFGSSIYYHLDEKSSFFAGLNYTLVQDKEFDLSLENSYNMYGGFGYFISKKTYTNISMEVSNSKFVQEETLKTIGSMLYYQLSKDYSISLNFRKELNEDEHNLFILSLGYRIK